MCLGVAAALTGISGGTARAGSLLLDTRPGDPGIQPERTVPVGSAFQVDVIAGTSELEGPLHAFEFDLTFDPAVLEPTRVLEAGFIEPPFELQLRIEVDEIAYAQTKIGQEGRPGHGIVASIFFDAPRVGTTPLLFDDVIFSAPFGLEIPGLEIGSGLIRVVPEPAPWTLLALALLLAGIARRLRGPTADPPPDRMRG